MTGPEFLNYTEAEVTIRAVGILKSAFTWMMGPQMEWWSKDGASVYQAHPIKLPNEPEIPEGMELKDVPVYLWDDIMNAWRVVGVSFSPDINTAVSLTSYVIGSGHPIAVAEIQVEAGAMAADPSRVLELLSNESQTRSKLGLTEPDLCDYANLDNALFDLDVLRKAAFQDHLRRRREMTPDEVRWEKMQKYKWLLGNEEVDKLSGPRWWGVSEASLLHAVYASSPDEAAVILEEHYKHDLFPFFFVEPYSEDVQPTFQENFEGKSVVRLIPFSHVGWPEDPDNMTDEQKAAFERLK